MFSRFVSRSLLVLLLVLMSSVVFAGSTVFPVKATSHAVTSLTLVNAAGGAPDPDIATMSNGMIINLQTASTLNIRANVSGSVGSVRFAYDSNSNFRTENNAVYAFAGNEGNDYFVWTPTVGNHTVVATPYANDNAGGQQGVVFSVSFTVINQTPTPTPVPPTPTPTNTPTPVPPTPTPTNTPTPVPPNMACNFPHVRRIDVASQSQLTGAVSTALPGDLIVLEDGVYAGRLTITRSGTEENAITLCGMRSAVFQGSGTSSSGGYGITHKANYWLFYGFSITNYQKGIETAGANHNIFLGLEVYGLGQEGIHFRTSSDNIVEECYIHHTGRVSPQWGEGVYVGIRNNVFGPEVTDTSVEGKEGTTGGQVYGNTFDGRGMRADEYAGWVTSKGNGWVVTDNTGTFAPIHAFQVVDDDQEPWGNNNTFHRNTADLAGGTGFGFVVRSGNTGNVIGCDNVVVNAGSGFANVACTP
jgi:hypothetical protein